MTNRTAQPSKALQHFLDEPVVRLMMKADRVDRDDLLRLIQTAAQRATALSSGDELSSFHSDAADCDGYRRGVGIVLMNRVGLVFAGRRLDRADAWQMPQGGLEPHETAREAAVRELREEIGPQCVEIISDTAGWFKYDLPDELVKQNLRPWRGQIQKWFLMRFCGEDAHINVATEHPEFSEWRWMSPADLLEAIVSFKRPLYRRVFEEFADIIGPY